MNSPLFAQYRGRLLALLQERAYEKRDVVLASGRRSDFYIDCRRVVMTAEGHFLVGWLLNHLVRDTCPEVAAVGGMSLGADPLVSATSLMSFFGSKPLDGFYVRKQAKAHGTGQLIEGASAFPSGSRVAILEDVVTTGGSSLLAVDHALAAGLEPVRIIALVDRCEGGREAIEQRLPLTSLFARPDFPQ